MIVTFFGSCSREYLNRAPVSFLVEDGDDNLLVDCGSGIISGMKKANKIASNINNLLLTHAHGDHISSIAYFVWYRRFDNKNFDSPLLPLNIYGQKDTLEIAKFNISHMYPKLADTVIYHEISASSAFNCGKMEISIIDAFHTVPTIGCVIKSENKKIVYSSDTIPAEEISTISLNPDLLIHEAMLLSDNEEFAKRAKHCTGKWAGEVATKLKANSLAIVHIEPGVFGKENVLLEEVRKEYSGLITLPVEGTVFNI